jgi:hypothetical protein
MTTSVQTISFFNSSHFLLDKLIKNHTLTFTYTINKLLINAVVEANGQIMIHWNTSLFHPICNFVQYINIYTHSSNLLLILPSLLHLIKHL